MCHLFYFCQLHTRIAFGTAAWQNKCSKFDSNLCGNSMQQMCAYQCITTSAHVQHCSYSFFFVVVPVRTPTVHRFMGAACYLHPHIPPFYVEDFTRKFDGICACHQFAVIFSVASSSTSSISSSSHSPFTAATFHLRLHLPW